MRRYFSSYQSIHFKILYSETPFERLPLLHQICGLIKGVASCQGYKSKHICLDLHCEVTFTEGLAFGQDGLSGGVPLYSYIIYSFILTI